MVPSKWLNTLPVSRRTVKNSISCLMVVPGAPVAVLLFSDESCGENVKSSQVSTPTTSYCLLQEVQPFFQILV